VISGHGTEPTQEPVKTIRPAVLFLIK